MKKNYWEKYLGIPYKHLGRNREEGVDCYGIVLLYYKEVLGIELKDWWYEEGWAKKGCNHFLDRHESQNFRRVNNVKRHDIILMKTDIHSEIPNHVAIVVKEPNFAIAGQRRGVSLLNFNYNALKRRVMGIYRCQN